MEEGTLHWGAGLFLGKGPMQGLCPLGKGTHAGTARSWRGQGLWRQHSRGPPWGEALQAAAPPPLPHVRVHACVCTRVSLWMCVRAPAGRGLSEESGLGALRLVWVIGCPLMAQAGPGWPTAGPAGSTLSGSTEGSGLGSSCEPLTRSREGERCVASSLELQTY